MRRKKRRSSNHRRRKAQTRREEKRRADFTEWCMRDFLDHAPPLWLIPIEVGPAIDWAKVKTNSEGYTWTMTAQLKPVEGETKQGFGRNLMRSLFPVWKAHQPKDLDSA